MLSLDPKGFAAAVDQAAVSQPVALFLGRVRVHLLVVALQDPVTEDGAVYLILHDKDVFMAPRTLDNYVVFHIL